QPLQQGAVPMSDVPPMIANASPGCPRRHRDLSQGRKAGLSLVFGMATAENIVTTTKCRFHRKE
ncbi:MAG: hypothetical protein AAAB11_00325, partial [Rhizobium giardinii]